MPQNINNSIVLTAADPRSAVIGAIKQASVQTGVDFAYLLQEAKSESSLNPQAQAATSSARGLFQFIESTWLETMDRHGSKYGLDAEAAAITRDSKGMPVVKDPEQRAAILKLRENPHVSALMAAELTKDNEKVLERKLGREVSNAELYMAHFLGAGGAAKFLDSLEHNPDVEAEYIVPSAARNNQAVFYKGGKALTLDQVYARFESKFEVPEPGYPEFEPTLPGNPGPASGLVPDQLLAHAAIPAAAGPVLAAAGTTNTVLPAARPLTTAAMPDILADSLPNTLASAWGGIAPNSMTGDTPARTMTREAVSLSYPLSDPRLASLATFQSQAMTMMALSALQALTTDTDNNNEWIV